MEKKLKSKWEDKLAIDKQAYALHVLRRFDEFQQKGEHCDFKVKVNSEEIPAHRTVLAAVSDYFNAMLSHDTLENQSGVVKIKEADAGCVRKCIDFMYNRDVSITLDECCDLIKISHFLQLHQLFDAAVLYYGDRLDPKTFFDAKKVADLYESESLQSKCDLFAFSHFSIISQMDAFMQLKVEYLSHLIKSKENTASEARKCDALLRWVKFDSQNRQMFLLENLKHLSLLLTPLEYRRFLLEREPLVYDDAKCLKLITTSMFENTKTAIKDVNSLEKEPTNIVVFDRASDSLRRFYPGSKDWGGVEASPSIFANAKYSAVTLNDQIYILGQSLRVFRLDYSCKHTRWQRVADLLMNHGQNPPSTVLFDCIYVVGSCDEISTSVERYYPLSDTWRRIAERTISCRDSTIASTEGYVYSIGGHDRKYLNDVERFTPSSSTWEKVAPMKMPRCAAAAAGLAGKVYVFGGRDVFGSLSSVEFFNPDSNVWTSVTSMGATRSAFRALTIQQKIYVVGGNHVGINSIEEYDAESDNWEQISTLDNMNIMPYATVAV